MSCRFSSRRRRISYTSSCDAPSLRRATKHRNSVSSARRESTRVIARMTSRLLRLACQQRFDEVNIHVGAGSSRTRDLGGACRQEVVGRRGNEASPTHTRLTLDFKARMSVTAVSFLPFVTTLPRSSKSTPHSAYLVTPTTPAASAFGGSA